MANRTIFITEEHMVRDYNKEQALRLIKTINDNYFLPYSVSYGPALKNAFENETEALEFEDIFYDVLNNLE